MLELRDFCDDDYGALAEVYNAAIPEETQAAESLRRADQTHDPKCLRARWMAEIGGRAVGVAEYDQFAGMYHPRKFWVGLTLVPEHDSFQHRAALWDRVRTALEPFEPLSVLSYGREDRRTLIEFLLSQGFEEKMRYWESVLDVTAFDPTPFRDAPREVETRGFEIRSFAQLETQAGFRERFFALWTELRLDVPRPDAATPISREQFAAWHFESPKWLPEANFFALQDGILLGYSGLWKSDGAYLNTGLTAVHRSARRNRLALAMKLRGIGYAKSVGAPEIRTGNEANNIGMLAINEMLGFVKQPAWIDFVKVLQEE